MRSPREDERTQQRLAVVVDTGMVMFSCGRRIANLSSLYFIFVALTLENIFVRLVIFVVVAIPLENILFSSYSVLVCKIILVLVLTHEKAIVFVFVRENNTGVFITFLFSCLMLTLLLSR